MQKHTESTRRLALQHHIRRVATECSNVVADPTQRSLLILQAEVRATSLQSLRSERKTKEAHTILNRHNDARRSGRKRRSRILQDAAREQTASMNPHAHWQWCRGRDVRGHMHSHEQAIVCLIHLSDGIHKGAKLRCTEHKWRRRNNEENGGETSAQREGATAKFRGASGSYSDLKARWRQVRCLSDDCVVVVASQRLRWRPSVRSDWRCCVTDAPPLRHGWLSSRVLAAPLAAGKCHQKRIRRRKRHAWTTHRGEAKTDENKREGGTRREHRDQRTAAAARDLQSIQAATSSVS